MTHVFHYTHFQTFLQELWQQRAGGGGLGPPEIDLFLRPNCLLNITDHQSCQKKELLRPHHKKELLRMEIYLKKDEMGGRSGVIFPPLMPPRWVAAALFAAQLVINAISRPKWNKSARSDI